MAWFPHSICAVLKVRETSIESLLPDPEPVLNSWGEKCRSKTVEQAARYADTDHGRQVANDLVNGHAASPPHNESLHPLDRIRPRCHTADRPIPRHVVAQTLRRSGRTL